MFSLDILNTKSNRQVDQGIDAIYLIIRKVEREI